MERDGRLVDLYYSGLGLLFLLCLTLCLCVSLCVFLFFAVGCWEFIVPLFYHPSIR